jgi:5-methyltetrahydrofolate--homocysteine methyltransferase
VSGLLEALLAERVLVLDGAMGTMLQEQDLTAADFGGAALEGCHENLVRTRPDVVLAIHRAYLQAGADIIKTNSFGATGLVLSDYGLDGNVYELNATAARLARQAVDERPWGTPRFVAGAMGPTNKAISVIGGVTFPQLVENFHEQAKALLDGGADLLLLETCHDTRNLKAGLLAVSRLRRELSRRIPTMVSGTIEAAGTMLAGQTVDAFCASISHADLVSIGLNCATGPEFMRDYIRSLSELSRFPVSCHPNAGMPDEDGWYPETPESLASALERFIDHGWLNIVGGCCGTTAAHIRAIAQMAEGKRPRPAPVNAHRTYFSGLELVEADEHHRPLIVGERTNVIGSRLFKNLIAGEKWDEATDIARRQVKNGAHIADVCLQSMDRDELQDVPPFYERLVRKIKAPIMIDTTDPKALELALTYCQGKSIINSINLEDGEEKFARVCPIATEYGAALVVGCIDEDPQQAQAFTRERKLAVATRSYEILTTRYGIAPEDVLIDVLVFPCAVGDANYIGGAVETIEAIRLVKASLPHVKTILGISNISFGLPASVREVVNSVFLYHCAKAGLDLAIVNSEKLERFASIPAAERRLAENLLFNAPSAEAVDELLRTAPVDWRAQTPEQKTALNRYHIDAAVSHFGKGERAKPVVVDASPDRRLARCVIEGTREGLTANLDMLVATGVAPLAIINGPLMEGMAEVGRLFGDNQLIVAEVLQSAEVMQAAVMHLQPLLSKADAGSRGTVLLATVKGDVHDIGKNLVEIILSNNGYKTVNLGIKVAPEALIRAAAEHKPDVIGLSGLLVKSTQQMVTTATDLRDAGIRVPLLVGGAALSQKFTRTKIAPAYGEAVCYAKDAMAGLALVNLLTDAGQREGVLAAHRAQEVHAEPREGASSAPAPAATMRSGKVRTDIPIPPAPSLTRRVVDVPNLDEVWACINSHMLYERQLGYPGRFDADLAACEPRAQELFRRIEDLKDAARRFMKVKAVCQFFQAERDANAIHLFSSMGTTPIHTFQFGRSPGPDGLCLSDYVLDPKDGRRDHLAVFVASAGAGVLDQSEAWKQSGEVFNSHAIQALAVATAEACAEWLHRRIREDWGFPDPSSMTMKDRFSAKYRGKRYSFGYSSCPNLDDQQGVWKLLRPEEIGVQLTEGMMMDPEASVSALVFHHPDCTYFSI